MRALGRRPRVAAGVIAAAMLVVTCGEHDVFDESKKHRISGYVDLLDADGGGDRPPAEGAYVEFLRDPGSNPLESRATYVDRDGHYELRVYMDEGECAPLRFFLYGYYEQDHFVCEADGDTRLDVSLLSAERPSESPGCAEVCDRAMNCEDLFGDIYPDSDDCLRHCQEGCVPQTDYFGCAYAFVDPEPVNQADKCYELFSCFQNFCDGSWQEDDDTGAEE